MVAGLLLLLSSFAVWVDRVALNTDEFVATSSELLEDEAIRTAVATQVVDELFDSVDVETEIEDKLPEDLESLSGPATAGLREGSYQLVARALEQPRLQRLWALSVEQSHETLVRVLESEEGTVSTEGGVVTLDLELIVLEAADRIGLRSEVEDQLPADVGTIEILRSDELDTAQDSFQLLKTLAWVLPLLALAAFARGRLAERRPSPRNAADRDHVPGRRGGRDRGRERGRRLRRRSHSSPRRRPRTPRVTPGTSSASSSARRTGGSSSAASCSSSRRGWPGQGAGRSRRVESSRRRFVPGSWAYAALVLLALVLLFTGPAGDFARYLFVLAFVALGVAWIELMRTQALREFPDASAPELFADARSRVTGWWEARRAPAPASASPHRRRPRQTSPRVWRASPTCTPAAS